MLQTQRTGVLLSACGEIYIVKQRTSYRSRSVQYVFSGRRRSHFHITFRSNMVLQLLKGACRHVASRLMGRKKGDSGGRKRISNKASLLLNSPVEVVLLIAERLSPTERLFLSQTCSDLRAILGPSSPSAVQEALDTDRAEFLAIAHKILPHHRFCDRCKKLHAAKTFDVPSSP